MQTTAHDRRGMDDFFHGQPALQPLKGVAIIRIGPILLHPVPLARLTRV